MTSNLKQAAGRRQIARKLSRNGRFQVLFVSYPQHPNISEFIILSDGGGCTRYINIDAAPDAKISQIIQ